MKFFLSILYFGTIFVQNDLAWDWSKVSANVHYKLDRIYDFIIFLFGLL